MMLNNILVCETVKNCLRFPAIILLLGFVSCGGRDKDTPGLMDPHADAVTNRIKNLTDLPVRVVWCQDIGGGSDAFATGHEFRLMGYDTEDGLGERVILAAPTNYSRPMITPRGDRVIFSTRGEEKIYMVNWDGTDLKELSSGLAVSVWSDPQDGREWIYAGTRIENSQTISDLRRFPVDEPGSVEPVWNMTSLEADNVQLSADGKRAGGAFPWPTCGVADLPNVGWKQYARGCWPALSPDDKGLLWVFDGSHRNLTIFSIDDEDKWTVNINSAPGIDGHEVYHPRWSNHARFMAITGPYTVGASANRIRAGGTNVEIHIGKFAPDFRAVEGWARMTHNEYADFYPDVWVFKEPVAPVAGKSGTGESGTEKTVSKTASSIWPGDTRGLIFLWKNRAANNEIRDPDGSHPRVCLAEPRGQARYGRYFEMNLAGGVFAAESETDQLLSQCGNSNALGIEAVITPGGTEPDGFAGIISFGCSENSLNFALGQRMNRLVFRLNAGPQQNGSASFMEYDLLELTSGVPHHVIVTRAMEELSCFLNGAPVMSKRDPDCDLSGWRDSSLVFGDADGEGWIGALEGIALYARPINESEAREKFMLYSKHLENREPPPRLVVDARLIESSIIPEPASIAPYRRALAANPYEIVRVIEGELGETRILAAQWVILDGNVLDGAEREPGAVYRMRLEPFDSRPELEGERLVMDSDEFALPMYYNKSDWEEIQNQLWNIDDTKANLNYGFRDNY